MRFINITKIYFALAFLALLGVVPAVSANPTAATDIVTQMDGIISQIDNILTVDKSAGHPVLHQKNTASETASYALLEDQGTDAKEMDEGADAELVEDNALENEVSEVEEVLLDEDTTESSTEGLEGFSYNEMILKEDIREQTIDGLKQKIRIDEEYLKARQIELPESVPRARETEIQPVIMTAEEIIRSIVKEEDRSRKIDLDFDAVKLNDIFMTLGKAASINVLLDPDLRDKPLDLHLKGVSLEEAFMLIANAYNLGFKKVDMSLYVTSLEKLKEQSMVSKVIKLRNINATEAETLIKDMIKTVNISEEINSLMLVGEPKEIVEIEKILRAIDKPQPQVILESMVVEVNRDALKDLGIDWSDSMNMDYRETGRPLDLTTTSLTPPKESMLQIGAFERMPIQLASTIKMLENQNKAKVLSNPRITTLNDKEAEIFVGDRLPYTVTNVTGGVVTTEVNWVEPGIRLKITPSIIEDDFVVIKVEPEVSFIFTFRGPNEEFPHVKTREATAYVRVKDKQPFMLGGLLNQEDKKNLYKVPMLGDVPLLGNLFSYEKHTLLDTELLITITPTIVRSDM